MPFHNRVKVADLDNEKVVLPKLLVMFSISTLEKFMVEFVI